MNNIMRKLSNSLDDAWFVDNNKTTSRIITIDASNCNFTIEGPREIIVKKNHILMKIFQPIVKMEFVSADKLLINHGNIVLNVEVNLHGNNN